jgi:hypothetical protein
MSPEPSRLHQILDELTDRWSERRAHRPLALLRQAWPSPQAHTDQWHELARAVRSVTALEPAELTPTEQELHAEARRLVNGALRALGQRPP